MNPKDFFTASENLYKRASDLASMYQDTGNKQYDDLSIQCSNAAKTLFEQGVDLRMDLDAEYQAELEADRQSEINFARYGGRF